MVFKNPFNVLPIPFPHNLALSKASDHLIFPRQVFTAAPTETPRLVKSKSFANALDVAIAVLIAPAIVPPMAEKSSGVINPFKNCANPLPNLDAAAYTLSQFMLLSALVNPVLT